MSVEVDLPEDARHGDFEFFGVEFVADVDDGLLEGHMMEAHEERNEAFFEVEVGVDLKFSSEELSEAVMDLENITFVHDVKDIGLGIFEDDGVRVIEVVLDGGGDGLEEGAEISDEVLDDQFFVEWCVA